jgi:hypothetical protein
MMTRWFPMMTVAVALAATPAAAQETTAQVVLGPLTAQLYYKLSGKLSDNLLARKEPFSGWNTVIGEGDAEEPAEDLLVSVTISSASGEESFLEDKLALWVTDAKGKILARREFDGVLVPYQGSVANPLWVGNIGCAGKLTMHARLRGEEKRAELRLDCGE